MELNLIDPAKLAEGQDINLWIQVFLLVVLFFYSIFALFVKRQINILNKSIQTTKTKLINNLGSAHLFASLSLLILLILMIIF